MYWTSTFCLNNRPQPIYYVYEDHKIRLRVVCSMLEMSDEQFAALIAEVMEELPREHMDAVKNVAIVYADDPTPEQREQLALRDHQSLFGLYEGVPLAKRQGVTSYPPDKITIFKNPVLEYTHSYQELRAQV